MTQGSIGTSGYLRLYNNKAYNKDYYERNKKRIMKNRLMKKKQRERNAEFILSENKKLNY